MSALRVLTAAPGASVQDWGRTGWRRFGVASSGVADRLALALANTLVGNPPQAAGIELTLAGARFEVEDGPVRLACIGAPLGVDGRAAPPETAVDAPPGAIVTIGAPFADVHACLALSGGARTVEQMGSRALHLRSGIGGAPLAAGMRVPCGPPPGGPPRRLARPLPLEEGPIRVIPGPQADHFTPAARARLLEAEWRVHPRSDRMGLRLSGPVLAHAGGFNIVSDAVLPGAIQVPGDGQPIVLMRDCQTTGGYPKIACVISADLDRLARIRPGMPLRFAAVSPEEALAAARASARLLRALADFTAPAGADLARLHSENLIAGVHDARRSEL